MTPSSRLLGLGVVVLTAGGCESIFGIGGTTLVTPDGAPPAIDAPVAVIDAPIVPHPDAPPGDFGFDVEPASVTVPYGGFNLIDVRVDRTAGYAGDVQVTVKNPPSGLTTMPLTIAAGQTTGQLQVGASGVLTIGMTFSLDVQAAGGGFLHDDTAPATVTGKPGTLDLPFGGGGTGFSAFVTGAHGGPWNAIDLLPDDKFLTVGSQYGLSDQYSVRRFSPDGTVDSTWMPASTTFCSCSVSAEARGVGHQLDGHVIIGGDRFNDLGFLSFRGTTAAREQFFANFGQDIVDLGGAENMTALAIVSDAIVYTGAKDGDFYVAREGALGSLDTTFVSPTGWEIIATGGTGHGLVADGAGNVIVVGTAGGNAVIARLLPSGALDPAWNGGTAITITGAGANAVALQTDGKIVVAGTTAAGATVWRFLATGVADASFGTAGATVPTAADMNLGPISVDVQIDGKLLAVGAGTSIARYTADGVLDPTFGTGGVASVFVGMNGVFTASTLTVDKSKLLVVGQADGITDPNSIVARIWL